MSPATTVTATWAREDRVSQSVRNDFARWRAAHKYAAAEDDPAELMRLWQGTVAGSRTLVVPELTGGGLDSLARPG